MPVEITPREREIAARITSEINAGIESLSPAERAAVSRIANHVAAGRTPYTSDPILFRGLTTMRRSERRELIALGKTMAEGVAAFEASSGSEILGTFLGVPESRHPNLPAGPAATSGSLIVVPWEQISPDGTIRIRTHRMSTDWTETLDDIRRRAADQISRFLGRTETTFRILL